ncbi:MAG: hypothetical protein EAZ08_07830 [Cytophagales bacterium]|nr:MAG: hypothetical protein EAZ08_07830 [Cytophagales bacterium]
MFAQIDSNSAWLNKGLLFDLPADCEVIADDSSYYEARKNGFSIQIFSFQNADFNAQTQAEATQKAAKKIRYDKMEKAVFFHLPTFKGCAIIGTKNAVKVQVISFLNQKGSLHFTALIVYAPEMEAEVTATVQSFWRRS